MWKALLLMKTFYTIMECCYPCCTAILRVFVLHHKRITVVQFLQATGLTVVIPHWQHVTSTAEHILHFLASMPVVYVSFLNGKLWLTLFGGHLHSVYIPSAQITAPWRLFLITCLMRQHGKCQSGHFSQCGLPAWRCEFLRWVWGAHVECIVYLE